MATISDNLQALHARIARATCAAGRDPGSVTLLAASKTHSAAMIGQAFAAGQRAFGENYVQEALDKMAGLQALLGEDRARTLEWHLIGPLQSNKSAIVARRFDWVHTVDREQIARRLSQSRPADMAPLNVLLQVNVSGEASKSGVPPVAVAALACQVSVLPRLALRGLMAIPAPTDDTALQRRQFAVVRALFEDLRQAGLALDTLSMGMSDDMESAILEGATLVRIGTAIFGARTRNTTGTRRPPAPPVPPCAKAAA